jgi:hypothetical protein
MRKLLVKVVGLGEFENTGRKEVEYIERIDQVDTEVTKTEEK